MRGATTKGPDLLHLVTATNRAYLPWCATTILSSVRSTPSEEVTFHVLVDDDVTSQDGERLRSTLESTGGELRLIPIPRRRLGALPPAVEAHGGAISCARFVLPELLADVERVVYLDSDVLVTGSLAPLPQLVGEDELAAVRNVVEPAMQPRLRTLGLTDPMRYLNSGVLVMNLAVMRRLDTAERLLNYVKTGSDRLLWVDQDALNVVLEGAWRELHPRWNVQNSLWFWRERSRRVFSDDEIAEALRDPAVLHFEGPSLAKPWHYLCSHPYVSRYRDVLGDTPWPVAAPVGRTPLNVLLKPLSRSRQIKILTSVARLRAGLRG
ncbi:MAG TPA: glycosyltransferase family 8 protein [Mycobacteriales bacterium]|nr:glycosyltransferase family 8 protein [Mycobacteriales bacterium]